MHRLSKRQKQELSVLLIALVFFISFSPLDNTTINSVSGYEVYQDNNVDADSDIDSSANIGTDGATSYTNAQTVNGDDQTISEADVGRDPCDPVDSASSDVDSSADLGTETNFANVQACTLDTNTMTITEGYGAGAVSAANYDETHDAITDTQSPSDLGTYSNDANMQSNDGTMNTLTEEDVPDSPVEEYLWVDGFTNDQNDWTHTGSAPYLDAVDGSNYITDSKGGDRDAWHTFDATSGSGSGFTANMSIYVITGDGGDDIDWGIDWTNDGTSDATGTINNPTSGWYDAGTISGLDTATELNDARIEVTFNAQAKANTITIDAIRIGVSKAGASNYRFDREFQFSSIGSTTETNEELVINTGTIGTESLEVYIWEASSWTLVTTIVDANDNTWVNTSISSYMDSSTEYFSFRDATTSSDTSQNTWEIDYVGLHLWTDANGDFEMDFEYQWTAADFNEGVEEVRINVNSRNDTENLDVNYWGGSWTSIGTLSGTGWFNLTATSLTSSTYTIQITDTSKTADNVRTEYQLDVIFLFTQNSSSLVEDYVDNQGDYNGDTEEGAIANFNNLKAPTTEATVTTGSTGCDIFSFCINIEVQFTSVSTASDVSYIAVRTGVCVTCISMPFAVWTGSNYNSLGFISSSTGAWSNFTITSYVTSTMYFRIATETTSSTDNIVMSEMKIGQYNETASTLYKLDWEHQVQSVDTNKDTYNVTIYGFSSSATESFQIQTWNIGGSSWNSPLSLSIGTTEQWYNQSIDANAIGSSITWRYIGDLETGDTSQTTLNIDYAGVAAWNFTVDIIEATFGISDYKQGSGNTSITENPLQINVSAGISYDIQVRAIDGSGTPVANNWLFFDSDSSVVGALQLTTSYQTLYSSVSPGDGTISSIYLWLDVPFGINDQTLTMTLEVRIVKS